MNRSIFFMIDFCYVKSILFPCW